MIATLVCLSAAVLVAPAHGGRRRLVTIVGSPTTRRTRVRPRPDVLIAAACVPALFVGGVTGLVAAIVMAATVVRRRRRRRRDKEQQAQRRGLLDGLEIVIAELRIGAHPAAACAAASGECTGVAADAFAVAAARSKLGGSAADGVRSVDTAIAAELGRIASAWEVAESHGIALAELLDAARLDLLGRLRFRSRTESSLAGARATATVLAGLPVLGILLGQLMGAAPLHVLLAGGLGGVLLVIGTVSACAGLIWTDAITERVIA